MPSYLNKMKKNHTFKILNKLIQLFFRGNLKARSISADSVAADMTATMPRLLSLDIEDDVKNLIEILETQWINIPPIY